MVADREDEHSPRSPPSRSPGEEHSFEGAAALGWTLGVWVASIVLSFAAVAVWALVAGRGGGADASGSARSAIESLSGTIGGVFLLVLPGQATFLAGSWFLARRTRAGPAARLGLFPGRVSASTAALCLLGTIGVQWLSSLALELVFEEPSRSLIETWRMLSRPTGIPAAVIGITIAFVPGVCEEVLFRGLLQRGLERRLSPFAAVAIGGVAFALAHLDVQHSLGVLPLGLWLGFLAWRTGSIRLAIGCHMANNASAFVFGRAFGDPDTGILPPSAWFTVAGIALCLCAAAGARALAGRPAPSG